MNMLKFLCGALTLVGCVNAFGGFPGGMEAGAPKPYNFGYNVNGAQGNHFHKETGNGQSVSGSYGYTDHKGLHRVVDYVADAGGFKASVKTNEPGTDGKENPAHVNVLANSVSVGMHGSGGGFGGFQGGFGAGGGKAVMYQW
ncbi:cuticle protein 10.9-like [Argiope bruennichi]|uniref:cuticle protein 10.9-like n=1 Tax=Argiope bruennichi TaxID=94029 RepID=UPI0024947238|nr:cuticle protein 10.9-like [Argiope bruennichi]